MSQNHQGLFGNDHHYRQTVAILNDHDSGYEHLLQYSAKDKVRRPPNAFMLFARDHRRQISANLPQETNKRISTILGQMWKSLPNENKMKYFDLAKRLDAEHKKLYPEYSYSPKDARMRKLNRLRKKGEKGAANEAVKRIGHRMPQPLALGPPNPPKAIAKVKCERNYPDCNEDAQNSTESLERNSMRFSEDEYKRENETVKTESKRNSDDYCPPDLGPRSYPLIGAMDDPSMNDRAIDDPSSDAIRMAESFAKSTHHSQSSSPAEYADHPGYRHPHKMPWEFWNPHPYAFGRRYPGHHHMEGTPVSGEHRGPYFDPRAYAPSGPSRAFPKQEQPSSCSCTCCVHTPMTPQEAHYNAMNDFNDWRYPYMPMHPHYPYLPMYDGRFSYSMVPHDSSNVSLATKVALLADLNARSSKHSAIPMHAARQAQGESPPVELLPEHGVRNHRQDRLEKHLAGKKHQTPERSPQIIEQLSPGESSTDVAELSLDSVQSSCQEINVTDDELVIASKD